MADHPAALQQAELAARQRLRADDLTVQQYGYLCMAAALRWADAVVTESQRTYDYPDSWQWQQIIAALEQENEATP